MIEVVGTVSHVIFDLDSFRRVIQPHARTSTKTGLAVCITEFKIQNQFSTIGTPLGLVTKTSVVPSKAVHVLDRKLAMLVSGARLTNVKTMQFDNNNHC